MDGVTYPERLYVEAERAFAANIHNLGGWLLNGENGPGAAEAQVVTEWLQLGRLVEATKNRGRWPVIELTSAGYAWCHENGVGS